MSASIVWMLKESEVLQIFYLCCKTFLPNEPHSKAGFYILEKFRYVSLSKKDLMLLFSPMTYAGRGVDAFRHGFGLSLHVYENVLYFLDIPNVLYGRK